MALFAKILKTIFHHPCLKYRRIAHSLALYNVYDTSNVNILVARVKTGYETENLNDCISKSIQSCNLRFDMLICYHSK